MSGANGDQSRDQSGWQSTGVGLWRRRDSIAGRVSLSPSAEAGLDGNDGLDYGPSSPVNEEIDDLNQSFSSCHSAPESHASCVPLIEVLNSDVHVISGPGESNGDEDNILNANLVESEDFSQGGNASQQGLFAESSKCSMQFAAACVVAVAVLAAVVGRRLGYLPDLPPCPYLEGCG